MDSAVNDVEVLSSERSSESSDLLITSWGQWEVREMVIDFQKAQWLWVEMQQFRTLFTDLTRGSVENLVNIILSPDSFWMEVVNKETREVVGVFYVTDIRLVTDASVHIVLFDRKPAEKTMVCKFALEWLFQKFPFERLSAYVPEIYHATIRLAKAIGFREEGKRRHAYLMGNKWVNETILGILRSEALV